jgi:hypothetical protein
LSTTGNIVQGNRIGTNALGTSGIPNNQGVTILGGSATTIGGTGPDEGNIVAFNTAFGVHIDVSVGNPIRGNSIHSNGGANDIGIHMGGNNEIPPPEIVSTVGASASGFACANCAVDIFSDVSLGSRFYEGTTTAAADGSFEFQNEAPFVETVVTATNTDSGGKTSELSTGVIIDSDAEDYDGHDDSDGCPDPDNDADGVCDSGLQSASCTGADSGKTAFFAAGHNHTNPTVDCRNTPEDFDAFKDGDGCPEPDNDNDGFPDSADQCPGDENVAGPDGVLGSGEDQNHNGILNAGEDTVVVDGVLTVDDVVLTYEDYDLVLNTDGCHDSPGDDRDGDGYRDEVEALHVGTKADDPCGTDAWPSDLVGTGISANRFDTVDLASFLAPVRRINTSPEDVGFFDKRWDLVPGTIFGEHINVQDLTATISGSSG